MITCTFYGQFDDLDYDLPERLLCALDNVLRQDDDDFEFLFYSKHRFLGLAWCAVQLLKRGYPQKHINLIYVGGERSECRYLERYFNHSVYPFIGESNFIFQLRKQIRWCIEHSDILVTQLYEPMVLEEQKFLNFAKRQKGIRIINILNSNTQKELWEHKEKLNPKEQGLIEWPYEGLSKQEVADKYHIHPKSVGLQYNRAVYKLRSIQRWKARVRHPHDCYSAPWAYRGQ